MKLHFEFTEAEAQIILNALAGRPYGEVAQLIQAFQAQAARQLQAPANGQGTAAGVDCP